MRRQVESQSVPPDTHIYMLHTPLQHIEIYKEEKEKEEGKEVTGTKGEVCSHTGPSG